MPQLDEVAFCHLPTRTLITCDLAFHFDDSAPFATRTAFRIVGGYGRLAPSVLERVLTRDRAKARASVKALLDWDFERAIVSHGTVVESGAKADLERGYAWLVG